jgi:hypothetical protein
MIDGGLTIPDDARECLERLLASDAIVRAPRVRGVLNFVVERVLAGEGDKVNEESIGQRVFGRPEGYNRGDDNIVRVTVRHLRARLEEYYATEGRNESWIFEIPKGNYVPVLRQRAVAVAPVGPMTAAPEAASAERPARRQWIPWVLCAALLAGYPILWLTGSASPPAPAKGLVQELFFAPGHRVSVITTDANVQLYRMMFQRTVKLSEYLDRAYAQIDPHETNPLIRGALNFVRLSGETSVASSLVIRTLQHAAPRSALRVRHPRELSMRDFQQDDAILLGGPWINPWGQLFEDRLNFRLNPTKADASMSQVENASPAANEPAVFQRHADGAFIVGYARIALLPNLAENGRVILVGATDHGAIEAGGQFLVEPGALKDLERRFGVPNAAALPNFELVLEVRALNSAPHGVRVVASRTIPAAR